MGVKTAEIEVEKREEDLYVTKITKEVQDEINKSRFRSGIATIFIGCTTASISTMEYNPESIKHMREALERVAPSDGHYLHNTSVGDSNGYGADDNGKSHVRSAIMGPSITIPFSDGKLMLDKPLEIVLLDFDIIKRNRKVIIQLMGE
ncbi:MAG: secondary thiamine-phosphate synthase enzyme YjbQ [Candidatus Micrarchaeota archaeon]|nr:secondary thiamine-phosphate synthase enzyme YjbQ [Candidatus Micrarchaeota archaeon]